MTKHAENIVAKTKQSVAYLEARAMLPTEFHPIFEQLMQEYKFAAFKHHGWQIVSPRVIAELVLMGWRSSAAVSTHPVASKE